MLINKSIQTFHLYVYVCCAFFDFINDQLIKKLLLLTWFPDWTGASITNSRWSWRHLSITWLSSLIGRSMVPGTRIIIRMFVNILVSAIGRRIISRIRVTIKTSVIRSTDSTGRRTKSIIRMYIKTSVNTWMVGWYEKNRFEYYLFLNWSFRVIAITRSNERYAIEIWKWLVLISISYN